ncbi:hypothetical protein EDB87DRAFT_1574742 [Lactarius vividus]|nr:hypothetical protein EDB87DRAFT_1574742 [Lactarius vividus]
MMAGRPFRTHVDAEWAVVLQFLSFTFEDEESCILSKEQKIPPGLPVGVCSVEASPWVLKGQQSRACNIGGKVCAEAHLNGSGGPAAVLKDCSFPRLLAFLLVDDESEADDLKNSNSNKKGKEERMGIESKGD